MAADRFLIAPFEKNSGLRTDTKPWLLPEVAFEELTNAYVFRGRVRKRFGSRWMSNTQLGSRLRIALRTAPGGIDVVLAGGAASGTVPGAKFRKGQMFSIGSIIYTVNSDTPGAQPMLKTAATTTATYNVTNGAFNFVGVPLPDGTQVYFYPADPVMALISYESTLVNDEPVVGFDTQFAYEFLNGAWERLYLEANAGDSVWTGNDAQFFWGSTWLGANAARKVLFVTNFNENEPNFMRTLNATTTNQWTTFRPLVTAADNVNSARIIIPFKNRLVLLNTWEGATGSAPGTNYQNRARYSQVGDPLAVDAFRQDISGKGNAIDAATTEAIITAEFVKDRLIVFFEKSTWELAYTGNQAYPFTWQQINTELGAESTFSVIPFDRVAVGVGQVGIHACNGANVDRIDASIPDEVFKIHNQEGEGTFRVYGIRDYFVEQLYWSFPDDTRSADLPYPNRVLVFDYAKGTWALNEDSITAFGYFYPPTGVTWSSTTVSWSDDESWSSGALAEGFRQVIAGNQQGYTFIIVNGEPTNAAVLQITDMTQSANFVTVTSMNYNLQLGDYFYIQDMTTTGNFNILNGTIQKVQFINDVNSFSFAFDGPALAGTYVGGGTMARVSNIRIRTKEFNFYVQQACNTYFSKAEFYVDRTVGGQIQVEFYVSGSVEQMTQESNSLGTASLLGTSTLDTFPYALVPLEASSLRIWHPVYFQADGEFVQLELSMNDEQMRDVVVRESDFVLHAIAITAQKSSSRLQ